MFLRYALRFRKWFRYASGSSYQHVRQDQGAMFRPGVVEGYFNDLSHKAQWTGVMREGVPVVRTDTDPEFFFPIVIFQWGLGNWDLWLKSGRADQASLDNALAAAHWALAHQSPEGGWPCWTGLVRPTISPYSAMAQGQGVSLLARVAGVDQGAGYLDAASRAAQFMLHSGAHGLTRDHGGWTSLEEYPGDALPGVLNGWIFAIFGLYDLGLAKADPEVSAAAEKSAADLAQAVASYDIGYWSNYDLAGNIASPFYHDLHITQLRTLALSFPACAQTFDAVAARFDGYRQSRVKRAFSILVKIRQKLLQPAVGEMA